MEVHIQNLRAKTPFLTLKSIRGFGYSLSQLGQKVWCRNDSLRHHLLGGMFVAIFDIGHSRATGLNTDCSVAEGDTRSYWHARRRRGRRWRCADSAPGYR